MNMSRHSRVRSQQRAISPLVIDLLLQFGKTEFDEGVSILFFDKQSRRRVAAYAGQLAKVLDQHLDTYAVVGSDMKIVTVGHRLERIWRH